MNYSRKSQAVVYAYDEGYRVNECGQVINPEGKTVSGYLHKGHPPYIKTGIKKDGKTVTIAVHRLVAYQKYGASSMGLQARHLDGDSTNNRPDNIVLGTSMDNFLDRSPEDRMRCAVIGATAARRFTDREVEEIRVDREQGMTFGELSKKWKASKRSLHYIVNKSYVTAV